MAQCMNSETDTKVLTAMLVTFAFPSLLQKTKQGNHVTTL